MGFVQHSYNIYFHDDSKKLSQMRVDNVSNHREAISLVRGALSEQGDTLENKAVLALIKGNTK